MPPLVGAEGMSPHHARDVQHARASRLAAVSPGPPPAPASCHSHTTCLPLKHFPQGNQSPRQTQPGTESGERAQSRAERVSDVSSLPLIRLT